MREIKFRAWDLANEIMVQDPYIFNPITAGHYVNEYKATYVFYETWQDIDDGIDRPCHIMQFTGLKDKNGKEIYEGDIMCWPKYEGTKNKSRWVVEWDNERSEYTKWHPKNEAEVIGNIYEHKHLLE